MTQSVSQSLSVTFRFRGKTSRLASLKKYDGRGEKVAKVLPPSARSVPMDNIVMEASRHGTTVTPKKGLESEMSSFLLAGQPACQAQLHFSPFVLTVLLLGFMTLGRRDGLSRSVFGFVYLWQLTLYTVARPLAHLRCVLFVLKMYTTIDYHSFPTFFLGFLRLPTRGR